MRYGHFAWDQAANGIEIGTLVRTDFNEYSDAEAHTVGATMRVRYVPRDLRALPDLMWNAR